MSNNPVTHKFSRERIEKAARIYHSNKDAAAALGCIPGAFGRMCRAFGILTPPARQKQAEIQRRAERDGAAHGKVNQEE